MYKVLFINHSTQQCGVHQIGKRTGFALEKYGSKYNFFYREANSSHEFYSHYNAIQPQFVIFNYYPSTLPWYHEIKSDSSFIKIGIWHELSHIWGNNLPEALQTFDYGIILDPTYRNSEYDQPTGREKIFTVGRGIPEFTYRELPKDLTIGSFGFAIGGKGYERIITQVQSEFDECKIRLHIPFATFGDPNGINALETVKRCKELIYKSGIELEITHEFLAEDKLLDWLSDNSLNAFFYDGYLGRGISSTIDYALAVRRPIAITSSAMMRHLHPTDPSIRIEETTIKEIINNGFRPLESFYKKWTLPNLTKEYEDIIEKIEYNIR